MPPEDYQVSHVKYKEDHHLFWQYHRQTQRHNLHFQRNPYKKYLFVLRIFHYFAPPFFLWVLHYFFLKNNIILEKVNQVDPAFSSEKYCILG